MYSVYDDWLFTSRVAPFGIPRIYARSQLPVVFRSPLRPSSPPDAKAFTICSSYLDLLYFFLFPLFVKDQNQRGAPLEAWKYFDFRSSKLPL